MFFKILQAVGTDFTLMSEYFNGRRTRGELKNKYKRELRLNRWRIDEVESECGGTACSQCCFSLR